MGKQSSRTFSAKTLRILLGILLLVSTALGAVGFFYGQRILEAYAIEVSHKKIDAEASNQNLETLKKMEEKLADNKDVLKKISLLRASNEFPEFRIVDEINAIAQRNGVSIDSYQYSDGSKPTGSNTPGSTPPATTPGSTSGTTAPTTNKPAGKTISLLITPASPVNYRQFLQFLYDIEQHLPKMKVDGIAISPAPAQSSGGSTTPSTPTDPNQVSVNQITVHLYIN